jgi:hypothetical protein
LKRGVIPLTPPPSCLTPFSYCLIQQVKDLTQIACIPSRLPRQRHFICSAVRSIRSHLISPPVPLIAY